MKTKEQLKALRESSKKRNFSQRLDMIVILKEFNLKKADYKLDEVFMLPKGPGKQTKVTIFADNIPAIEGCKIVKKDEIEKLSQNKKELKNLIADTTFFLSEPPLMPVVGKFLGKFLAPIGKMPKPLAGDPKKMAETFKKGVRVEVKRDPVIRTVVGLESMSDDDLAENIEALVSFLKVKLPKGKSNIGKVKLKFSMSKPIVLEVD